MGYRIVYGEDPFVERKRKSHLSPMTAAFALALVLAVRLLWPEGTAILRDVLVPAEDSAFQQMTAQIRAGEPIGEAVTAFCRTVMEEAVAQPD